MRCGRSRPNLRMPVRCEGPKRMGEDFNRKLKRWRKALGGSQEVLGGAEKNAPLHKKLLKQILKLEKEVWVRNAKGWIVDGER